MPHMHQGIGEGWARMARIDSLEQGDFVEVYDGYGEVVEIKGPHGPLGTPPSTDWFTMRVVFEDRELYPRTGKSLPTTVGPKRGSEELVCWS